MVMQIGFLGGNGRQSTALGESLRPLLPADCNLRLLSIPQAKAQSDAGELAMMIVAFDTDRWRADFKILTALRDSGDLLPIVVLALVPRYDPTALVAAFDLGAADVACLPIEPLEVRARLAMLVRRRRRAASRADELRAARRLAAIDPLTGLYTRQHLETLLPTAIAAAEASARPLAVLMVDLDALKPFNDRWGHAAGDLMLRAVADVIVANLRTKDTVGRLGGDEMVVVMPDTDNATARHVANRLVAAIEALKLGDGTAKITVSIGMTTLMADTDDAQTLLWRADASLYRAKKQGRNRVADAA